MSVRSVNRSATMPEVVLLAMVLACLPLFEAPKNVFSVLFLIVWVMYAILGRGIGRSSPFDLPIAGLAVVLWISPVFSNFGDSITPLNSAPRWTLLAVFVLAASRLDYTRDQAIGLMIAVMAGGLVAIAESFYMWSMNGREFPEFRSVGHVNHSSMYSLIPLGAALGVFYLRQKWIQVFGVVTIIATLFFTSASQSLIGAAAVTIILVVGVGVQAWRKWSLKRLVLTSSALAILLTCFLALPTSGIRTELASRLASDDIFSSRTKILNSSLAVWDRHPLLGTGWFSFGVVTSEGEVRAALAEDGLDYDPALYAHHAHGHNLWTTILIERGLVGLALVIVLLVLYFWTFLPLVSKRDRLHSSDHCMAVSALLTALGFLVAGLGNTTMMNEHGHAGMTLIAVCYGYLRGRCLVGGFRQV